MEIIKLFVLLNIALLQRGFLGAIIISVFNIKTSTDKDDKTKDGFVAFMRGWFITSFILLQYLYKLGLSEKSYKVLPPPDDKHHTWFILGASLEINSIMSIILVN